MHLVKISNKNHEIPYLTEDEKHPVKQIMTNGNWNMFRF
jgi:hypothetical protein